MATDKATPTGLPEKASKPLKKLTAKQEHFAQLVVSGRTKSESYCESYNTSHDAQSNSVRASASRLASKPHVAARILELEEEQLLGPNSGLDADLNVHLTRKEVLTKLKEEAENTKSGSAASRIRALELIGKHQGMFDDTSSVVENKRPSEEVLQDIVEKLAALFGDKAKAITSPDSELDLDQELLSSSVSNSGSLNSTPSKEAN